MTERPVESVRRSLSILEALNRQGVSSIQTLFEATRIPKPTIVRMLRTLCQLGYAAHDKRQGGYLVASKAQSLSCGFHGDPLVIEAAKPWAIAFTQQYHWPIAVAVLECDAVSVRFSTIPDSPVSPFHGTLNLRLSLLGRALGRAYLAFCPTGERAFLIDILTKSKEAEDMLAQDRDRTLRLLSSIRRLGYAERDPLVKPQNSNTVAMPIFDGQKVLATVGVTFFNSAVARDVVRDKYVPLLRSLSERISQNLKASA